MTLFGVGTQSLWKILLEKMYYSSKLKTEKVTENKFDIMEYVLYL